MVIRSGIDNLNTVDSILSGKCIGLMTHATGIDRNFRSTIDILRELYSVTALFAVEHGLYGEKQAGEEYGNGIVDGCPIYSMYGSSRAMTKEMTDRFDVFCFDIQDVGLRFYTYLYSLAYAMEACATAGKKRDSV